MRGARPRVARVRRLEPRRRQLDLGERDRRLGLRLAEAEVLGDAGGGRAQLSGRLLVLEAPAPVLASAALQSLDTVSYPPGILARGPWKADQVASRWREEEYEPPAARSEAADEAIAALEDRGSPAHDGLAARLAGYEAGDGRLELELQPMRWSLRLVREDASASLAALCVTRAADGRWLAGRRAVVGRLVGRALGARRRRLGRGRRGPGGDAHARARGGVVGGARAALRRGARLACPTGWRCWSASRGCPRAREVTADAEHDEHAWWPADPGAWPEDADPALRQMAAILA